MMKVYVTKYALTTGIATAEVTYGHDGEKYVYTKMYLSQFVMGQNAFFIYEEASVAACAMRDKKVKVLKKQLVRVSGLVFPLTIPENLKKI